MKNLFNTSLKALLLAAASMSLPMASWADVTQTVWSFDSSAKVAAPVGSASAAGVHAVSAPGKFSMGWLPGHSLFGGASGLWDLGRQGTITVGGMGDLIGDDALPRTFTVRVVQWVDGGIYTVPANVSVPGAMLVARSESALGPVSEGAAGATGWMVEETQWRAEAGVPVESLTVTAAYDGSVIDSLAIESAVALPADLVLSIQPASDLPGSIELSWPESAGTAVLESCTNPAAAEGWSPMTAAPVAVDGRYQVKVPASESARFFRLRR